MQQFFVDLIEFNYQLSHQDIDQQPTKSMSVSTVQLAEVPDSLLRPTLGISDREALRFYRAMDLAG